MLTRRGTFNLVARLDQATARVTAALEWERLITATLASLPDELRPPVEKAMRAVPVGDKPACLAASLGALPADFREAVLRELRELVGEQNPC